MLDPAEYLCWSLVEWVIKKKNWKIWSWCIWHYIELTKVMVVEMRGMVMVVEMRGVVVVVMARADAIVDS